MQDNEKKLIHTVRGTGYVMREDDEADDDQEKVTLCIQGSLHLF